MAYAEEASATVLMVLSQMTVLSLYRCMSTSKMDLGPHCPENRRESR